MEPCAEVGLALSSTTVQDKLGIFLSLAEGHRGVTPRLSAHMMHACNACLHILARVLVAPTVCCHVFLVLEAGLHDLVGILCADCRRR